ncbi:MAG: patatin-like phospholipase family protein [Burkholderiaceae bacterium]|nr:patatin-like phospholipase family protein [Burkholderiaceae bacterium]
MRLASPAPKKILTLDGGGIRGLIALEVLAALEQQLAARSSNPDGFVLADYFDFVAGTSTGAIIAAAIAYGMPVARIQGFYRECGAAMFEPANWLERFHNKYRDEAFSQQLQVVFGAGHTLGNAPLRTLLMMVMRNASTDQAWCVTNNPHAKFNLDQRHPHLDLPLWRLVRASAAAPSYFPPESVQVGEHEFIFIDGGISSYNNPAFRALLTATAAPYGVNWATGEQSLLLVSVGTGTVPHVNRALKRSELNLLYDAKELTPSMILSAVHEQDLLCRTFGRCLYGPPIDKEVGDMVGLPALGGRSLFSYVRYNADLTAAGLAELGCTGIDPASVQEMDSVAHLDSLAAVGRQIARVQLRDEHFFHFPPA